jgi:hypothetical protein
VVEPVPPELSGCRFQFRAESTSLFTQFRYTHARLRELLGVANIPALKSSQFDLIRIDVLLSILICAVRACPISANLYSRLTGLTREAFGAGRAKVGLRIANVEYSNPTKLVWRSTASSTVYSKYENYCNLCRCLGTCSFCQC